MDLVLLQQTQFAFVLNFNIFCFASYIYSLLQLNLCISYKGVENVCPCVHPDKILLLEEASILLD